MFTCHYPSFLDKAHYYFLFFTLEVFTITLFSSDPLNHTSEREQGVFFRVLPQMQVDKFRSEAN